MAWPQAIGVAASLGGITAAGLAARGLFSPRSSLFGPVIWRGNPASGGTACVSLTFDDGPHPQATPAILDILRNQKVSATFFIIGAHGRSHGELLKRMHDEGHLVANHSFDHHYGGMFGRGAYWHDQIARTDEVIASAIGRRPRWFRPPMGFKQLHITRALRLHSHCMVTWTRRAFDGVATTPEAIVQRLGGRAQPGDILLLHDGMAPTARRNWRPTVDALPRLIERLRERGIEPACLDAMIDHPAYHVD